MNPLKLSIITPVYNQVHHTVGYLSGHWAHMSAHSHVEWIIVDNGSSDSTSVQLAAYKDLFQDRLKIITNAENLGFAHACNQGALRANGDFLLFLNNDVSIRGDYSGELLSAFEVDPSGLFGVERLDRDAGWNVFGGQIIPYLAGWFLGMSKSVFFVLGGFDELFSPAYYEDMDLCYRAQKDGCNLYKLNLPVGHISGQTGMYMPDRDKLTLENQAKFAKKWGLPQKKGT